MSSESEPSGFLEKPPLCALPVDIAGKEITMTKVAGNSGKEITGNVLTYIVADCEGSAEHGYFMSFKKVGSARAEAVRHVPEVRRSSNGGFLLLMNNGSIYEIHIVNATDDMSQITERPTASEEPVQQPRLKTWKNLWGLFGQ
jgi:hypothetical protein